MRLLKRAGPKVQLKTDRFVLDTLTRRQLARMSHPWTNDPQVMEAFEFRPDGWSLRVWERRLLRSNNRDKFNFGIREKKSGAIIGYEAAQITKKNAFLTVVIGDRTWWGRGVVLESRAAVLDFLFGESGCVRAWGLTHARNFSSVFNYLRLGFHHEGILRSHMVVGEDTRGDALAFGILRDEWLSRRGSVKEIAR